MSAAANVLARYEQPLIGRIEGALRNCLLGAGALGVVALLVILLAPALPEHQVSLEEMPERYARLILEKPAPVAAPPTATPAARIELPAVVPAEPEAAPAKPKARPEPVPPRRAAAKPKVAPDQGVQGRERAQKEVTGNLTQVTASLDKALDQLTQVLPTAGQADANSNQPPAERRRRGTRSGRSGSQLAAVEGVADVQAADLGGSTLSADAVAIAGIADLDFGGDSGGAGSGGNGGGGGASGPAGRSNDSLLAVVRRYAPGIQFCYENELKRDPGLRGKLTVSLTVAADGRVTDVAVVEDSLGAPAVVGCALEQMRGWVFPVIESGTSTFKAPFVFTPPD